MPDIPPASDVLKFALAVWAAGTVLVALVTRFQGGVQPGHFKVVYLVGAGLAGAGFAVDRWVLVGLLALVSLAAFGAVYAGLDRWVLVGAGVIGLAVVASSPRVVAASASALLLGAVTNAMLLGHWHLNQPRLGTVQLRTLVWVLWAGTLAFLTLAASLAFGGRVFFAGATALAFTAFSGVLTAMVHHLVKTRSIMSATGILYLQVLLCFVAVFTGVLGALA